MSEETLPNKPKVRKNTLSAAPEKAVIKDNVGSAKAQKVAARLAAVQVLYQIKLNSQDAKSALNDFIEHRIGFDLDGDVFVPADKDFLKDLVSGCISRDEDISSILEKGLAAGKKTSVEILLESIIKLGIYELLANSQVDAGIIINNYLNITNGFYEGSETKIVNAILDKAAKQLRS